MFLLCQVDFSTHLLEPCVDALGGWTARKREEYAFSVLFYAFPHDEAALPEPRLLRFHNQHPFRLLQNQVFVLPLPLCQCRLQVFPRHVRDQILIERLGLRGTVGDQTEFQSGILVFDLVLLDLVNYEVLILIGQFLGTHDYVLMLVIP